MKYTLQVENSFGRKFEVNIREMPGKFWYVSTSDGYRLKKDDKPNEFLTFIEAILWAKDILPNI